MIRKYSDVNQEYNRFQELPLEIIYKQLSYLDFPSLMNFCQSSSKILAICSNDFLWKYKFENEFQIKFANTELNPKDFYIYNKKKKITDEFYNSVYHIIISNIYQRNSELQQLERDNIYDIVAKRVIELIKSNIINYEKFTNFEFSFLLSELFKNSSSSIISENYTRIFSNDVLNWTAEITRINTLIDIEYIIYIENIYKLPPFLDKKQEILKKLLTDFLESVYRLLLSSIFLEKDKLNAAARELNSKLFWRIAIKPFTIDQNFVYQSLNDVFEMYQIQIEVFGLTLAILDIYNGYPLFIECRALDEQWISVGR